MKNFIAIVLVFAFAKPALSQVEGAYSQQLQGVATYQTQRHIEMKMDSTSGMNNEMQKSIQEQLRKQFQKEYSLTFNGNEKIWKENASIAKPQMPTSGIQIHISTNDDELYHNLAESKYVQQTDLMGKPFLVTDSLKRPEWKLEKEIKNIGQYTCFKATLTEEITNTFMTNATDETEVKKETRVTTAWYTLDIPVKHGPDKFWGLPGLILEVNDGKMAMMCTKVVLNPREELVIETPTKGKEVDQKEYDRISEEKTKEMMERYQSKSSKNGSKSFSITIDG